MLACFFALEDFVSRGFTLLKDRQSMTDVLCAWSKPSGSQKVDARPIRCGKLSMVAERRKLSGNEISLF